MCRRRRQASSVKLEVLGGVHSCWTHGQHRTKQLPSVPDACVDGCPGQVSHLSEQLLEGGARQAVPRDGVGDGGEDPVELAQRGLAVRLAPGDPAACRVGQYG